MLLTFLLSAFSFWPYSDIQCADAVIDTGGIIFISADNGATWTNAGKGLPDDAQIGLGAIAVAENMLSVSVKKYGIYLFDLKLQRWRAMPTPADVINANPAALVVYKNAMYAGTQFAGVFVSSDKGQHWQNVSTGLKNKTIRRFLEIDGKLYAGTNAGLFSYDEHKKQWNLEYGNDNMQVNGIASYNGNLCIGTNQGAFLSLKGSNTWKQIMAGHSLHNISAIGKTIYAMTYNELFASENHGVSWQSIQKGLPEGLYTFNVLSGQGVVFAGQWDGVYRRDSIGKQWIRSSVGLPAKFAQTNMKLYKEFIIVSGSGKSGFVRSGAPANHEWLIVQ